LGTQIPEEKIMDRRRLLTSARKANKRQHTRQAQWVWKRKIIPF